MKRLARYLGRAARERRRFLVIAHPHADPDAVGCVIALGDALKKLGAPVRMGVPGGLSRLSKSVLDAIRRKIEIDPPTDVDIVVLVDTSSLDQLGKVGEQIREKGLELIVIDHHRPSRGMLRLAKFYHVDENASSAAELVLRLIREMGVYPSSRSANLLLAGIISDTGQFRFANRGTFEAVNALLGFGASYSRALHALATPDDPSKRVAMLKAAQRTELHKIHGWWVALSELSSFEADAAAMLIKVGADIALVGSEEKRQVRLSGRAREEVVAETELHLGEVMSGLAKAFGGTGGGHAAAASATVKADLDEVKRRAIRAVWQMLGPKEGRRGRAD